MQQGPGPVFLLSAHRTGKNIRQCLYWKEGRHFIIHGLSFVIVRVLSVSVWESYCGSWQKGGPLDAGLHEGSNLGLAMHFVDAESQPRYLACFPFGSLKFEFNPGFCSMILPAFLRQQPHPLALLYLEGLQCPDRGWCLCASSLHFPGTIIP